VPCVHCALYTQQTTPTTVHSRSNPSDIVLTRLFSTVYVGLIISLQISAIFLLPKIASFYTFYAINYLFLMPLKRGLSLPDLKENSSDFFTQDLFSFQVCHTCFFFVFFSFVFFVLQRAFLYFLCTVSGCDGGNRTRNIVVYTWRLSPLSYDRHRH
jgi:hypothetical protein